MTLITGEQIKKYRQLRDLSLRDLTFYSEFTPQYIGQIETGVKDTTPENMKSIMDSINKAFYAKVNGTFTRESIKETISTGDDKQPDTTTPLKKPASKKARKGQVNNDPCNPQTKSGKT